MTWSCLFLWPRIEIIVFSIFCPIKRIHIISEFSYYLQQSTIAMNRPLKTYKIIFSVKLYTNAFRKHLKKNIFHWITYWDVHLYPTLGPHMQLGHSSTFSFSFFTVHIVRVLDSILSTKVTCFWVLLGSFLRSKK